MSSILPHVSFYFVVFTVQKVFLIPTDKIISFCINSHYHTWWNYWVMSIEQETVFLCMNSGCIGRMFARGLTPKWLHFVLLIVTKIEDVLEDLFGSIVQLDIEVEKQRCISNGVIFNQYHHNILDVHKWGVYTLVIPKPLFSPIKSMPVCQYTWY